jgi:hypothetical protein
VGRCEYVGYNTQLKKSTVSQKLTHIVCLCPRVLHLLSQSVTKRLSTSVLVHVLTALLVHFHLSSLFKQEILPKDGLGFLFCRDYSTMA